MGKDITITKRDGSHEVLDLEKMHKVVFYACDGCSRSKCKPSRTKEPFTIL